MLAINQEQTFFSLAFVEDLKPVMRRLGVSHKWRQVKNVAENLEAASPTARCAALAIITECRATMS